MTVAVTNVAQALQVGLLLRQIVHRLRSAGDRVEDPIDVADLVRLEPRLARLAECPTRFVYRDPLK